MNVLTFRISNQRKNHMFKLKNLNDVDEMIEDDCRERSHNPRAAFLQLDRMRYNQSSYLPAKKCEK